MASLSVVLLFATALLIFAQDEDEGWSVPGEGINPELEVQDGPVSKTNKLKIEDLFSKPGCSMRSEEEDRIYWKYKGTFLDGTEFDSGTFMATLGSKEVIIGVDKAMRGMCVGDKRRMYIHSDWGYGDQGTRGIPGGATLVFDVELLSIKRKDGRKAEL